MKFKYMHPAEQIIMLINRIYQKQMTTTSGGNLSILDSDGNIWITPSGIDKGSLSVGDICCVKKDGTVIGKYKPSVELPFHKLVYETKSDAKAVLHAHPPALVSYSLTRTTPETKIIPAPHLVCGEVGIAEYEVPGSMALGKAIVKQIKKGYDVVIMDNHGVITVADDLFSAFMKFETLENCAKLDITSKLLGKPITLTEEQIDETEHLAQFNLGEFIPNVISSEEKMLRNDMCKLIHRAYDQDLFTSTQGTFSQRLGNDSFLITPCGMDRKYLEPSDIVRVDNGWREAGKNPSRAVNLHRMIYQQHSDVNAITMAHPTNIMAFGITRTELDSRTIPESYIAMRDIVRVPFGSQQKNPELIASSVSMNSPVVLIENDCVLTIGNTLINAFDKLEVAEFTARTLIDARQIGEIKRITDEEVAVIDKAFNLK